MFRFHFLIKLCIFQNPQQPTDDTTTMILKVTPPTPGTEGAVENAQKLKNNKSKQFDSPGPEEFHEVAIDVPNYEKRQIAFDLEDDEEMSNSFKKRIAEDDDEPKQIFEKSRLEKILNIILCRKDLVDAKLPEQPVKFWDLVSIFYLLQTALFWARKVINEAFGFLVQL